MQCPNCHFENMPGIAACGRCGASLQLQAAAIAVHPPRASAWQKRWRRWFPTRRRYYAIRDFAQAHARIPAIEFVSDGLDSRHLSFSIILRLCIPGWAHAHLGMKRRGTLLFISWLAFLVGSIVCYGSSISGWCIGFAVAIHGLSIADLFATADELNPARRILIGVVTLIVIASPYGFLIQQLSHYVASRQYVMGAGPFAAGDVVLYQPNAYESSLPQLGDVVVYRNRSYRVGGYGVVVDYDGEWIDRIVGVGPCTVRWNHGQLWLDGKISPYRPLDPSALPDDLTIEVGRGDYCVLASTIPHMGRILTVGDWTALSIVGPREIRGRVFLRNFPLNRWKWFQ